MRVRLEFPPGVVKVDLLRAKMQRPSGRPVSGARLLRGHAKGIGIEKDAAIEIDYGQDQMVQAFYAWAHLPVLLIARYDRIMHEATGKTQSFPDQMDPARAAALHIMLGLSGQPPVAGDALPPFGHQIYFWDPQPAPALGRDGHPAVGTGLIPDLGLPIRMWAGGRLVFDAPLRIGEAAEKRSTVEDVVRKDGRTGPLGFVTLRHEVWQRGRLCVTEHQDIVYRTPRADAGGPPPKPAPTDEAITQPIGFDTTQLFRYSALTFNGHRIHYDIDYARQVEGYGGLVVHGPLLAQYLMLMAQRELGALTRFSFRATAPLIHDQAAELCWRNGDLWVRVKGGRLCMEAHAA